jgi:hypothetical protein
MKKLFLLMAMLLIAGTTNVYAIPILNDNGSGPIDTFADGSSYGTYRNSGSLLFIEPGNNSGSPDNLAWVESLVEGSLGLTSDFQLIATGVTWTSYNSGLTGTWATDNMEEAISFYAVKAGKAFAMYLVDPAESTGSWSTFELWASGLANKGADLEISHFTGYNPTAAPVPEPASLFLLGTGLLGLAGATRKKFKKS